MQIALKLTHSIEDSDAPGVAIIDITPAQAQSILRLHARTREFIAAVDADGLATRHFDVSLGLGGEIPRFEAVRFEEDEANWALENSGEEIAVVAGDEATAALENDDCIFRSECHRIEIGEDAVTFVASPKFHDGQLRCASLSLDVLIAISTGSPTGLPEINLSASSAGI